MVLFGSVCESGLMIDRGGGGCGKGPFSAWGGLCHSRLLDLVSSPDLIRYWIGSLFSEEVTPKLYVQ